MPYPVVKDGLSCDHIRSILEDREGYFWFGTNGGGVCKYDGMNFQEITTRDGLAYHTVRHMIQDKAGHFWFATPYRVTRHTPLRRKVKPHIRITQVMVDKAYEMPATIESSTNYVTFEYKGLSLKTQFDRIKYIYKLEGVDTDWIGTHERRVRYEDLKPGEYLFQVKAIDRDLNHSDAATVKLTVIDDPRRQRIAELESDLERRNRALEQANAALRRSNTELEQFASVASHDLQEPLRKIQAFGDRLKAKYGHVLDDRGRDYLERMQNGAGRMRTLITDLLTLSRVTTRVQPFVPVDLVEVARGVVSDLETRIEQTGGRVEVGDLPTIDADATQMRQLLQNLIDNGLKFHRPDVPPVVKISAKRLDGPGGGELCQMYAEDNGIGFDEKHLDRVFAPFQRLHGGSEYEGTGMGLAICRKIVERHGGSITGKSSPGQGATFIVTLPRKQPREENANE